MTTVGLKRRISEVDDAEHPDPRLLVKSKLRSSSRGAPSSQESNRPRRSNRSTGPAGTSGSNGPAPLNDSNVVHKISLAKKYEPSMDVSGWVMSEKLDGMRAVWHNGALYSRGGNKIHAPAYFISCLPRGCTLDGELWMGRGRFQDVMSVCRSTKQPPRWKQVKFVVFDSPDASGGILERLESAKAAILEAEETLRESDKDHASYVEVLDQTICHGKKHVEEELRSIEQKKGEGLMLRHPTHSFEAGRTRDLLKVKSSQDDEALVIGHEKGSGKNSSCLGALVCRSRTGKVFKVGSGFTDQERHSPPRIQSVITYKFFELTKSGIPRFPTFDRIRPDVSATVFA